MPKFRDEILNITRAKRSALQVAGEQFIGHCPCHDDQHPSLSILFVTGKANPLLNCFAGCERRQIINYFVQLELWSYKNEY